MKRIGWIDSLRGIASLAIFSHHFLLTFFPASYFGNTVLAHYSWEMAFAESPLAFVVNGNFWVFIFLMISGFVIAHSIYKSPDSNYGKIIIKRYFRLAIPIFVVSFIVYFMLKGNLLFHSDINELTGSTWTATHYDNADSVRLADVLISSFYGVEFKGDATFSTAFWMLSDLFFGYFVSIILAIISKERNNRVLIVFLFMTLVYFHQKSYLLMAVLGAGLAYLWNYSNRAFGKLKYIWWIFVLIGFLLGGYPTGVTPDNFYDFLPLNSYSAHACAAFLLMLGLFSTPEFIKDAMSNKVFIFMGKISFSLYLIHIPLLFSFSHYLFLGLNKYGLEYQLNALITYAISTLLLVGLSYLFEKYIERNCYFVTDKILNFICRAS